MMQRMQVQLQTGFTLLELMISLLLIIILFKIALPSMQTMLQDKRLAQAGETFYQDIILARSIALKQKIPIYVAFQNGSSWCYGLNNTSNCNCNISNSCQLNGTTKSVSSSQFSGISLNSSAFTGSNTYFEPVRGIPNNTGTLTFTNGSKNLSILINALGYAKLCSSNLGGYPACS